jgi:LPS sulfotransferase NodH
VRRRQPETGADEIAPAGDGRPFAGDEFESRTAWILGSPRTGSTWLLRLLAHPIVIGGPVGYTVPRGYRFRPSSVIPVDELYLPVHLTPQREIEFEPGVTPEPSEYLLNSLRASDPNYFFSDEYADAWRPEVRRLVLTRLHAQAEREAGNAVDEVRVVVKEPNGSHGAQLLMSLFPRAGIIFLVRDGRDVISSLIRAHQPGGWLERLGENKPIGRPKQREAFISEQSHHWVLRMEAVERAYRDHPADRRFEVHYEEMTSRPRATLRGVLEWMDLERTDAEIDAALDASGADRPQTTSGTWRDTLSPREREIAASIMGPKLRELGYRP